MASLAKHSAYGHGECEMIKPLSSGITISASTPVRAKLRDILVSGLSLAGIAVGTTELYSQQYSIIDWIYYETSYEVSELALWAIALTGYAATIPVTFFLLGKALAKRKKVLITPDKIKFRRWGQIRAFDRTLPSRFVLRAHDRAEAERDRHQHLQEKARLKGKARKPRKYYQVSHILSLEHVGEAHDIMPIHGERAAKNILARLNAVMAQMDGAARSGKGVSITPQDEWHNAAGGLPNSTRS